MESKWTLLLAVIIQIVVAQDVVEHREGSPNPQGYEPQPQQQVRQFNAVGPQQNYGSGAATVGADDPWPLSRPDMPSIKNINVQCEKSNMRVFIEFDRPFYGMIFSKGHYSDVNCVHMQPGSGALQANFDIFLNSCGMSAGGGNQQYGSNTPQGTFVENTIIIQYDPLVQEVWDQARRLRCTWYDYYEKSVTFRPFNVDMLNAVTANFLGDNLQCWMQIQVGKGPWASEVSGIVKIGQTMTMVLAIQDDENKFDMLVRNCVAHDGNRAPIQLVDQFGCVVRPKIMSQFQKIKNFGSSASVVSYAYFQAFKFPDSMNVHFQCVIQVCKTSCPEPQCQGHQGQGSAPQAYGDPRVPSAPQPTYGAPAPVPAGPQYQPRPQAQQQPQQQYNAPPQRPIPAPAPIPLGPNTAHIPQRPQQGYSTVNREGLADSETDYAALGGQPRSSDGDSPLRNDVDSRKRRDLRVYKRDLTEMADVETSRTIQVVSPGDVAFSLRDNKETIVRADPVEDNTKVCLSVPGFAAGVCMLLAVLTVAGLVAAFLFMRVRQYSSKGKTTTVIQGAFDNPEFVKALSSSTVSLS